MSAGIGSRTSPRASEKRLLPSKQQCAVERFGGSTGLGQNVRLQHSCLRRGDAKPCTGLSMHCYVGRVCTNWPMR